MPGYSPASAPKTCGMTDARRSSRRGATASQPLRGLVTGTDHRDRLRPRPCAGRPVVERGLQDRRGHQPRSAAGRGLAGPGTRWCGSLAASADALKSFQQRETHSLTTPLRWALLCLGPGRLNPWSVAPPAEKLGSTGWSGSTGSGRGIQDPVGQHRAEAAERCGRDDFDENYHRPNELTQAAWRRHMPGCRPAYVRRS
jgi:hypothetical protein